MQVSRRTKFSLSQLLGVIEKPTVYVILDKFGFDPQMTSSPAGISNEVTAASEDTLTVVVKCFRPPSFEFSNRPVLPHLAAIRRCVYEAAMRCNNRSYSS